jgi:chromosome segregation ATPase
LTGIQKDQSRELNELKAKFEAEEHDVSERKQKLDKRQAVPSLDDQSELVRQQNQADEESAALVYSQELGQLRKEFEEKVQVLRARLSEKFDEKAQNELKSKLRISRNQKKNTTFHTCCRELDAFDNEAAQQIDALRESQNDETVRTSNDLECELTAFQTEFTAKTQIWRADFEHCRLSHTQELSASASTQLREIENEGLTKDECNTASTEFQQEFDDFSQELNQIQPPKLDDNTKYRALNSEFESLQKEKQQRENEMQSERAAIDTLWKSRVDEEIVRHQQAGSPSVSGRN